MGLGQGLNPGRPGQDLGRERLAARGPEVYPLPMEPADVDAYLRRIGVARPSQPNLAALSRLQMGHLWSVPFENLDIARGIPLSLDPGDLFEKVVVRRRGGFCYELNSLFAQLLEALGFKVTLVSARVYNDDGILGLPFDHLALVVDVREPVLVDVGFGDGFRQPLRLESGRVQTQTFRDFLLEEGGDGWLLNGRFPGADWEPMYLIDPSPRRLAEFEGMFRYHQTSPESPFPNKRVCTLATSDGRITLHRDRLVVTRAGEKSETPVPEGEWWAVLEREFGIQLAP